MDDLKPLSVEGIPRALAKAERYRLLNEPRDAESICRDILRTDPDNQPALMALLLALTDQFGKAMSVSVRHAEEMLPRIEGEYPREYYAGVICERWAKAQYNEGTPGYVVFDWIQQAMAHYEKAISLSPPDNEDAVLRWNACARIIRRNDQLCPRPEDHDASIESMMHDDVPM